MSTMNDMANDLAKRQSIIDACLRMNQLGINQGTSGNISLRHEDGMLITPTSTPYEAMQPEQIVFMKLDGAFDAKQRPSSEWRFHRDILKARPEVNAVVHAHPPYATILAIMGLQIPPDPLHDRMCRRRYHPVRALRDVRNTAIVATCGDRPGRQVGLSVGASRHDCDRAIACKSDVACGRSRNTGAAVPRLPSDRHAAASVKGRDRKCPRPNGRIWAPRRMSR